MLQHTIYFLLKKPKIMTYNQSVMKLSNIIATAIHLFTGVGALAGGSACLVDPFNPLGAPASMLEGSPFSSFLIPGLVLFILFGFGNLIQLLFIRKNVWWKSLGEGVLGGGMILWIGIQVAIIDSIVFLHIAFLVIGIIQAVIALRWAKKDKTIEHLRNMVWGSPPPA
jgi:hypothetical protein